MPVYSTPADKPKIVFYGAMMAIQNFGFFTMYYALTPFIPISDDCSNMRFWVTFFAIDCFVETFCCLWMAMGGYIDSCVMFAFGWFLHLFVALPYCISSVGIPYVVYSDAGTLCRFDGHTDLIRSGDVDAHCALPCLRVQCSRSPTRLP